MHQIDVDVGGAGIEDGAGGVAVAQQRKLVLGLGHGNLVHALLGRHQRVEGLLLRRRHEEDGVARGERLQLIEMNPSRAGQGANGGRTIIWLEGRSRASGGVVARPRFHLKHQNLVGCREMGGSGGPGDAGSNDDDVEFRGHGRCLAAHRGLAQRPMLQSGTEKGNIAYRHSMLQEFPCQTVPISINPSLAS